MSIFGNSGKDKATAITVRIDFPALTDLLAYLRETRQQQIDELTAKVTALTESLHASTVGLKASVDEANK